MWKTMMVKVEDKSTNSVDHRFEDLNDFLGDCASGLDAIIDALKDLKDTLELYDFTKEELPFAPDPPAQQEEVRLPF